MRSYVGHYAKSGAFLIGGQSRVCPLVCPLAYLLPLIANASLTAGILSGGTQ